MKLLLTITLFLFAFFASSQDSLSRNYRSFRIYSGLPFERAGSTSDWYNPDFEIGFDVNHSFRIKNHFFASIGLGINYSRYRTDPFVRTWTTYSFSPWFGVYNVQHHSDDYERQTRASFLNVRIPIQLEYMPQGKWKPYAKIGVLLDVEVDYESTDVYAHTNTHAPVLNSYSQNYLYGEDFLLSGIASGGVKIGFEHVDLLFGLTGVFGFYEFDKKIEANSISIGAEFSIRKRIPNGILPNRGMFRNDSTRNVSSRYVYVEGLGSGSLVSLNFEQTLVRRNKYRLNHRFGFGFQVLDERIFTMPIGLNWIWGQKHAFELGCDAVPVIGSLSESLITPHIGYRAEVFKRLLLRFNVAMWLRKNNLGLLVAPGISFGTRF